MPSIGRQRGAEGNDADRTCQATGLGKTRAHALLGQLSQICASEQEQRSSLGIARRRNEDDRLQLVRTGLGAAVLTTESITILRFQKSLSFLQQKLSPHNL